MSESLLKPAEEQKSQSKAAVLVGIVTHNRAGILPKAIRSALSQTYPQVDVTVLDDGSADGTPAVKFDFPEVRWRHCATRQGVIEARNQLMRTASADYYLSLDDDAWFVGQDEIASAIEHLESNPNVAAVAFDILSSDRPDPMPRSKPRPTSMFIGCGHVVRTEALRECGFYTASPGLYGSEEKDLCLRLLDRHWDVHLLPGVHVWHDKSGVARNQAAQHRSGVCNDLVFAFRRCPLPLMLIVLPGKMASHLRFAIGHSLLRTCLEGFGLFFRNVRAIWRSRNPVRAGTFREFLRRCRETA